MKELFKLIEEPLRKLFKEILDKQAEKLLKKQPEIITDKVVFVNAEKACEMLDICKKTLDNWYREGLLQRYQIGRIIRYKKKDILTLLKASPKYKRSI